MRPLFWSRIVLDAGVFNGPSSCILIGLFRSTAALDGANNVWAGLKERSLDLARCMSSISQQT